MPSLAAEDAGRGQALLPLEGTSGAPLPPHVREAIVTALDEHDARPPSRGLAALREAIGRLVGADPEREVLVTNGAMHALSIVFRALVGPGESVLVPTPGFFFGGPIEAAGARPVSVPAPQLELEALEAAIDRSTRALVLCNPVNPTGFLPDEGHVAALLELARRHGLLIVTDEAYDRYVYGGAAVASAFGPPEVVLVRSIGKSYALPSWRLGFVAGPAELVTKCHEVLEWEVLRVSHVAQRAATAAIEGPQDWLEELRAHYERNRDLAYAALRATPLACELPRATPFLFPDVTAIGGSRALLEAGIPCVDGAAFGAPGFARVAFGGDAAAIEGLVEALRLQQFGTS